MQRAEKQRSRQNTEGLIPSQQRNRNSDKTEFRRKADSETAGIPQDLPHTDQPGQTTCEREGQYPDFSSIDARGARGRFALTDRAQLKTKRCAPQEEPN